ncbi:MAG: spermidine/putrescine ABC transporter ATP-binding protein PotA [Gammaproteobacteria bacterium]|nr:spermidine/putrescine ABC transporter ATP-binding protein PotA [Gammaproteobacteria bacterium]
MTASRTERRKIVSLSGVRKAFGNRVVLPGLDLDIYRGEFVTLLGPSGCGKTTILRLIGGFESPDAGSILLDGEDIAALDPSQRPVNTVFQSYALFPHMSVFDNVAYGLRAERRPEEEIERRVGDMLRMVQLEELARRKPDQLSGGQQQRVAIARALVKGPRLLLLDEPLSALDYKLRKQMQNELKRMQRELGITFLFITHDQEEALSMSDRVVVLRDGVIEQSGTPRDVYESPANLFVARFVGEINVLDVRVIAQLEGGRLLAEIEGKQREFDAGQHRFAPGTRLHALLRPEDMRLLPADDGSALPGEVVERNYKGMMLETLIRLDSGRQLQACEFFDESDPDFDYLLGERVGVSWVPGWEVLLADEGA